jgi:hypothetical protein
MFLVKFSTFILHVVFSNAFTIIIGTLGFDSRFTLPIRGLGPHEIPRGCYLHFSSHKKISSFTMSGLPPTPHSLRGPLYPCLLPCTPAFRSQPSYHYKLEVLGYEKRTFSEHFTSPRPRSCNARSFVHLRIISIF